MVKKGDSVRWKYANGHAEEKVVEVHKEEIEKTKGSKIKRNGSRLPGTSELRKHRIKLVFA